MKLSNKISNKIKIANINTIKFIIIKLNNILNKRDGAYIRNKKRISC